MLARGPHGRKIVFTSVAASALVGFTGTLLTAEQPRVIATIGSTCIAAMVGLALGATELALLMLAARPWQWLWQRGKLERFFGREEGQPREPVVWLHAFAVATLAWSLASVIFMRLLLARLSSIESQALMHWLAAASVALLLLLGALVVIALTHLLQPFFAWVDARVRLPLPANRSARRLVWLCLPLLAVGCAALFLLEGSLGPLSAPLWLFVVWGVQVALWEAARGLDAIVSRPIKARSLVPMTLVATVGLLFVADRVLTTGHDSASATQSGRPGRWLVELARVASDFDRDGDSAFFGGRDCAGLDRARAPQARDIPANGIDEDCNGHDAKKGRVPAPDPLYSGQLRDPAAPLPDVVWFVIDALRADHTGALGYARPTTVRIDQLAEESLLFSNALSQSSATMLSFPSFLTGIDPARIIWREARGRLQPSNEQAFIWQRLAARGYVTGFVAHEYFKRRLPGLLHEVDWIGYSDPHQRRSSLTSAALATDFIVRSRQTPKPFFLLVYLPAPHAPYVSHGDGYPAFPKTELGRYDQEIHDADRHVGFVLDVLRSDAKRWKNTVVVVNGDHGEEFLEHGGTKHARTCHIESLHVPLVVRVPGVPAARIAQPVALVDVAPTLLEITGVPPPAAGMLDGQSLLVPVNSPEALSGERPLFCSVLSQKAAQGSFFRRSVRQGRFKLMRELRGADSTQLFDVEVDPGETKPLPLRGHVAEVAEQLQAMLNAQLEGNLAEADLSD